MAESLVFQKKLSVYKRKLKSFIKFILQIDLNFHSIKREAGGGLQVYNKEKLKGHLENSN
jgi:hypothetical protein